MAHTEEAKLHFLDYWRVIRVRWVLILLAFFLVLLTAAVVTYFQPREFQSSVVIEVKSTAQNVRIFGNMDPNMPVHDPQLAPTVFQIIQRTGILYPVIEDLNLQEKWSANGYRPSREQAYQRLRSKLDVQEVRNTDLLQISVFSTDPQEASDIANKIVGVYQSTRVEEEKEIMNRAVASMNEEVAKQQKKVDDAAAEVSRIREEEGIVDLNQEGTEDTQTAVNTMVVKQEGEVNDAETKVAVLSNQLQQIERLKGEDLMRMMPTLQIQDPTIQKIQPIYQETVAQEALLLNSGLGENHPKVRALRATKEVYVKQLEEQVTSIRSALEKNLRSAQTTRDELAKRLEQINQKQLASKNLSATYTRAKNNYIKEKLLLDGVRTRAQTHTMEMAMPRTAVSVKQVAEPPSFAARPRVGLNLALGALVGLVLGLGLAFFIEYLDTSVKTMDDVESLLGVPVLAIIPKNIKLLHKEPGDTPDAEAYRILRTNIEFNRKSPEANAISLVSGGPGEGKSTTLANLAFTSAQGGYTTLIVDADLRRPVQHAMFDVSNKIGLTNYLTTNMLLEDVILPTSVENLSLLPSGILPSDAVGILNSQRMSDMIAELKTRYDIVFLDSPPMLGVSDASVLASEVDQTIIVVQHRRFPRAMLTRVKQAILGVGGNVLGVVLNNVDLKHDQNYYYYTNYYGYYTPRDKEARHDSRRPASTAASNGSSGPEEY
ncbi:MAG: polysaccharide biosynthesis tyrosine autokinase [Chthoniobacterales bacterium]|nr:polysaccharide biosynthesis tyrosine autokinase [Chthoniobacterales bacterium]MDQ3120822.1 polysaccharide biosynthesis tyrosine autokinase [Verrucomicrobiota bacterium]